MHVRWPFGQQAAGCRDRPGRGGTGTRRGRGVCSAEGGLHGARPDGARQITANRAAGHAAGRKSLRAGHRRPWFLHPPPGGFPPGRAVTRAGIFRAPAPGQAPA
ncbi:hypothetical protein SCATT_48990 [Streptantibioticus cattleyicolor NRRL 8057 = DSM 46488]|uniref:Uncharacterized protein n=1 Tax=Streptantibioticus cattleyicolor (strain ATCC 35852 / DSM 46488 / JCM 4925 / NBRC 14057 / NRRL 8057) TaxID=1003195 RepID=G8WXW8_STREN|nr:hypothetical protein SCATT_48990 [Streptantibioticus cattleyicolor NRRL 8057 = DSM 46488]